MENQIQSTSFLENVTFLDNAFDSFHIPNKTLSFIRGFSQTWTEESKNSQISSKSHKHVDRNQSIIKNEFIESKHNNLNNRSTTNKSDLSTWGLPIQIVDKYKNKGVESMFPWQVECLSNSKVLEEYKNLIYSAPTSAGKTLVAEILTIKNVLERKKKVIIILPFVSVVREKMFYFQDIFSESGVRVEGFMGSHTPPGGFQSVHIAICTIEKANSLVNRLLEEGTISELGAVVVDELHLIGDVHRGYILELLLTKLIYVTKKFENAQIQIIGMSATLPNLDLLSRWLEADLYKTDFRPIPLEEYFLMSGVIYNSKFENIRRLSNSEALPKDNDFVVQLCLETIAQNCSVLIFCPTKNWCENLAQQIASTFQSLGYSNSEYGIQLRKQFNGNDILEVLEQLKCSPVGLDGVLQSTISFGVAFHHAGLTLDERDIIEGAFKRNVIRVLVATSTLSSGVNLPARRVIIRSPTFCTKPINIMTYKQMVGRGGRMGIDSAGESILICSANEKKIAQDLLNKEFEPISSCLDIGDRLMRSVLEAIASQIALTKSDIELFINCTLFMDSSYDKSLKSHSEEILSKLEEYELIRFSNNNDSSCYTATPLGKACLSSSMSPLDGLTLFIELQKARESFVLETDLHMTYLVTPYSICSQWGDLNWLHFLHLWENLSAAMKRVGRLIGIQESFIYSCMRNSKKNAAPNVMKKYQIYKRFYTSLALQDLINEIPLNVVAEKFSCSRGMLQSLQQSAATFAGMVTAFSHQLGWKSFEILVSQFQDRLNFGIQSELLDLMRLQSLNGNRARAIFNAGIETVCQLATSNVFSIENILNSAIPFQSDKIREGEDVYDANKRNNLKSVWITGKTGVTAKEAAELLIFEARTHLKNEMGLTEVNWVSKSTEETFQMTTDDKKDDSLVQEYDVTSTVKLNASALSNKEHTINNETNQLNLFSSKSTKIDDIQHSTPNSVNNITSITAEYSSYNKIVRYSYFEESMFNSSKSVINESIQSIGSNKNIKLTDTVKDYVESNNMSNFDASKSLFEDSFSPDTQLCGILDKKETNVKENENPNIIVNANIVRITTQEMLSLENIFSSSFEIKDDESDIKLNTVNDFSALSDNIVPDSQNVINDNTSSKLIVSKSYVNSNKRQHSFDKSKSEKENMHSPCKMVKLSTKDNLLKNVHSDMNTFKNYVTIDLSSVFTKKVKEFPPNTLKYFYCDNLATFKIFHDSVLHSKVFSISIDIEKVTVVDPKLQIGFNVLNNKKDQKGTTHEKPFIKCASDKHVINGIAFYVDESNSTFYIDLQSNKKDEYLDTVLNSLRSILNDKSKKVILYNSKYIFSALHKCCKIGINCEWEDPLIADWLLDSECSIKSLSQMAESYCFYAIDNLLNNKKTVTNVHNYHLKTTIIEAWTSWCIMKSLKNKLLQQHTSLLKIFDIEMKALKVLACCETSGISVNKGVADSTLKQVKTVQKALEKNAFQLTGRRFKFTSSSEVAKVLGLYKGRRTSTNKRVLEKINNPLAQTIIYWRKLNTVLTKNLFPLLSKIVENGIRKRIHGVYWTHTSTGRMSMQEPNLQSIPRNFHMPQELFLTDKNTSFCKKNTFFSCRDIFSCSNNSIFVSADYCQLELRLLTHMCRDLTLLKAIKSDQDIFKAIASSWKCISLDEVDDDLRQNAKQMCYGIIYGMGVKSLAETLDVGEIEADTFMRTFHAAYPGIKYFTNKTIESCKRFGYVETLNGRRRYLPSINSNKFSEKSHAERQAVNTTIQGSAADILKSAMISVQEKIEEFHKMNDIKLVLLLHDELIYEVPESQVREFYKILKESMENTVKLSISLPVKIKIGKSWGQMNEAKF